METATRRILANLAWIGLILVGTALAQDASPPGPTSQGEPQMVPVGPEKAPATKPAPGQPGWIVGEQAPDADADAVFGNRTAAGCETCGGGACLPPLWSAEADVRALERSAAKKNFLAFHRDNAFTVSQVPNPPPPNVAPVFQVVDAVFAPDAVLAEVRSMKFDLSGALNLSFEHYLGRDGNERDHFMEVELWGLDRWTSRAQAASMPNDPHYQPYQTITGGVPIYYTEAELQNSNFSPIVSGFTGAIYSNFPFVTPQDVQAGRASKNQEILSDAFNNAESQIFRYTSTFNSFEWNTRVASAEGQDRLVLNPNGRWYRQCESGFNYSYLFGLRAILLDERFEYLSSGGFYNANHVLQYEKFGRYVTRTENNLLGLQGGGNYEYRFCTWTFDIHGKGAVYINVADQTSHLQADVPVPGAPELFDRSWKASRNPTAVSGELGFGAKHTFRPNVVGHVSYDFMWLGEVAQAPTQLDYTSPDLHHSAIDTKGTMFLNGLTLGLDWTW